MNESWSFVIIVMPSDLARTSFLPQNSTAPTAATAAKITHRMLKDSPVCGEVLPESGLTFGFVLPFSGLVTLLAANAVADSANTSTSIKRMATKRFIV